MVDSINDKKVIFNKLSKLLIYQRDEDLKQLGIKSGIAGYHKKLSAREKFKKYFIDNPDKPEEKKIRELTELTEAELDEVTECLNTFNESAYEDFKYYLFTLKYSLVEFEGVTIDKIKIKNSIGIEIEINNIESIIDNIDHDLIIQLGIMSENQNYISEELKKK